jgi:hypothetical protein
MNSLTVTAELPRTHRRRRTAPRLVGAEWLKLRRRRGLVLSVLGLTVAPMVVATIVLLALDGPAGGKENFEGAMGVLVLLSVVAGILVGATVGTADLRSGVFRELVVTGRSRLALFAARVPAGLALLLPIVGAAFAVMATTAVAFAGAVEVTGHDVVDYTAPSATLVAGTAGWLALSTALSFVLALGFSSLVGSIGTSLGVLLGFWLVATPVLLNIGQLGALRQALVAAPLDRLAPAALFQGEPVVPMSLGAAAFAIAAWIVVPLALGAWRTATRDA